MATGNPTDNGPWRVLVLDRDPDDPKWLIVTVTMSADIRPAVLDATDRYTDWEVVTEWAAAMVGRMVVLVPMLDALAWRMDENRER
jgi:hypothetical protein